MQVEHFQFGILNNSYVFRKSIGLNNVLSAMNLRYLKGLGEKVTLSECRTLWFKDDAVLVNVYLKPSTDEFNRANCFYMHAVVIPIESYLALHNPTLEFQHLFIKDMMMESEVHSSGYLPSLKLSVGVEVAAK